ncbi:hypothetical protein [Tetragenococcus solitarius]|uniref:DUF1129 family protein n=1 Tax=Tetragenococcus solitarius TaxID=71453 RepID=A0ABN3YFI5_9ENTE|nr:hypothetical protein [Tetragenococcus solitarius]
MKTSELIEENTRLQHFLTKVNEKYYENLVIYVRAVSLFRDEKESELLLLEILQDILEGQEDGLLAEEYFGKNPKQTANEIIHNLPIKLSDTLKIILYGIGAFWLFAMLPELTFPAQGVDIGSFIVTSIYAALFALFSLYLLGRSTYHYQSKLTKVLLLGLWILGIAIGVGLFALLSTPWKLDLSGKLGVFIILLIVICLSYLFYKEKNKKLWLPLIPVVLISATSGLLSRTSRLYTLFSVEQIEITIAIAIICGLLLQGILVIFNSKK